MICDKQSPFIKQKPTYNSIQSNLDHVLYLNIDSVMSIINNFKISF